MQGPVQTFALPVVIQVQGHAGPINQFQLQHHVEAALGRVLSEDLADRLDRDPDRPTPFAYQGAAVYWEAAGDVGSPDPDSTMVVTRLTGEEAARLRRLFDNSLSFRDDEVLHTLRSKFGLDD